MKIKKVMEGPRDGEIRCLAFRPKRGIDRAGLPSCGIQWRISWPYPKTSRLQGPVWEKYPKPGEQILKK